MIKNLYAYTSNEPYLPEFLSVNETDGKIHVTLRSKGDGHSKSMELPRSEWEKLSSLNSKPSEPQGS